jgi:hypothetical protein
MAITYENLCGNSMGRIELTFILTVHSLKIVKLICNGIKKMICPLMKCHTNVNSTPPRLPHEFSYVVAILIHNHFESPNIF